MIWVLVNVAVLGEARVSCIHALFFGCCSLVDHHRLLFEYRMTPSGNLLIHELQNALLMTVLLMKESRRVNQQIWTMSSIAFSFPVRDWISIDLSICDVKICF